MLQNPVYTYTQAGTYTVSLNVTNVGGSDLSVRTNYITVTVPKPIPDFQANARSGTVPLPVSFTDLSSNNPTGWAWYFGDENFTAPWTQQTANAEWPARVSHSSVAMPDGSIVLMGGMDNGYNLKNDTWRSTDNGATWTEMNASAGWSARSDFSSVLMPDGSIVLMGGMDSSYNFKNDTWRSTDNGATWTEQTANAGWPAREDQSSVAMPDGSIVLMGGFDGRYRNDTWRSTDNGETWIRLPDAGWVGRYRPSSVAMPDGSIVLMGGMDSTYNFKNDTWRSIDSGATWTRQNASAVWPARYGHTNVAIPDGSIVLMGGFDGSYRNDVWRSADNGETWIRLPDAGWAGRYSPSSVAMPDGSIVLMGGFDSTYNYQNDTWRFMTAGSSEQNPSHTYTLPGNYTVALQAFNAGGYNSTEKTGYIMIESPVRRVQPGGTAYIGESGLDISTAMATNTTLAWWPSDVFVGVTAPSKIINVTGREHAFSVSPDDFVGYTGAWYSSADENPNTTLPVAFNVVDPAIDFSIWDYTTGRDVTGRAVPVGDDLGFIVNDQSCQCF